MDQPPPCTIQAFVLIGRSLRQRRDGGKGGGGEGGGVVRTRTKDEQPKCISQMMAAG